MRAERKLSLQQKNGRKRHFDFSLFRGKLLRCVKFNVYFLVVAQPLLQADMLVGLLINSSSHMFKSQKIVYRLIKYHYKIYTIDCRPENFFYWKSGDHLSPKPFHGSVKEFPGIKICQMMPWEKTQSINRVFGTLYFFVILIAIS